MQKTLTFFLLVLSTKTYSNDFIQSLRSIFHVNNGMYISSARNDNHSKHQDKLQQIWQSNTNITFHDKFKQDWKSITTESIQFNKGSTAKYFIVFNKKNIRPIKVNGASLFKWGCDDSIIPVLNLGKWPFKNKPWEWEGTAIETEERYGLPEIFPAKNTFLNFLPDKERKRVLIDDFPAVELKWKDVSHLKFILAHYETDSGSAGKELIILNTLSNHVEILKSKSPFDSRC